MRIIRTVADLREALRPLRDGSIGFVPTMGAIHEGHLSLLRAARQANDHVVLSIFVNPTQFNDPADLKAYTRNEDRDAELARSVGVDIIFAPSETEMYPDGFATTVTVGGPITEKLEAATRGRSHFDGMATVVTKLLLGVLPDRTYFGAKDAQQAVVVRRLIADLHIPVELVICDTSRDPDGLARSSRNARLTPNERTDALAIPRSLQAVADSWQRGEREVAPLKAHAMAILQDAGVVPDYLAFVDPTTLEDVAIADHPTLVLIAATIGETRLIDNVLLDSASRRQT